MEQSLSVFVARERSDKEKKIEELSALDVEERARLEKGIESEIEKIVLTGNSYSKKFCEELGELFKKSTKLTVTRRCADIFETHLTTSICLIRKSTSTIPSYLV